MMTPTSTPTALLLSVAAFFAPAAIGADLHVPSAIYPTVQAAVDAAVPKDRIVVAKGNYAEWVKVTSKSDLTIVGQKGTRIESLHVNASTGVRIERISFESQYGYLQIYESDDCEIRSCRFVQKGYGIVIHNSTDTKVLKCDFDAVTAALWVSWCKSMVIDHCDFDGCDQIAFFDCDSIEVVKCDIRASRLRATDSTSFRLVSNTIKDAIEHGIHLVGSPDATVSKNHVTSAKHSGIFLEHCPSSTLYKNKVVDVSVIGLKIAFCDDSLIKRNQVKSSHGFGITLSNSGSCDVIKNTSKKNGNLDYWGWLALNAYYSKNKFGTSSF